MSVAKLSNYEAYKQSVKDLSLDKLGDLYYKSKLDKEKLKQLRIVLATLLVAIAIITQFSPIGIKLSILTVGLGVCIYLKARQNDFKEKVLEDIFRERGKQPVFESRLFGLRGFDFDLLDLQPAKSK